jgi:hypothetical protein
VIGINCINTNQIGSRDHAGSYGSMALEQVRGRGVVAAMCEHSHTLLQRTWMPWWCITGLSRN